MTSSEIQQYWDRVSDSDYSFKNVSEENRLVDRRDLCAFLLISKLLPPGKNGQDIISGASHDEIYLNLEPEDIPNEQILHDLRRCGVHYNASTDHFYMFV